MALAIKKATKKQAKLRMALVGASGTGKTYTSLAIASALGGRVLVLDSEHGSASKYSGIFEFDVIEPDSFSPNVYIEAIQLAEKHGYDVIVLDSLSHAWMGKDGALELVDRAQKRSQNTNSFAAWRDVTPLHNQMIDAIVSARVHVIATMRAKTEYVIEQNGKGKSVPRKVGVQPVQRDGMEYEFDVVADLNWDNELVIGKTRCPALHEKVFVKAGGEVAGILNGWLSDGVAPEVPRAAAVPAPALDAEAKLKKEAETVRNLYLAAHRWGYGKGVQFCDEQAEAYLSADEFLRKKMATEAKAEVRTLVEAVHERIKEQGWAAEIPEGIAKRYAALGDAQSVEVIAVGDALVKVLSDCEVAVDAVTASDIEGF